jgi:hypothetical protein
MKRGLDKVLGDSAPKTAHYGSPRSFPSQRMPSPLKPPAEGGCRVKLCVELCGGGER